MAVARSSALLRITVEAEYHEVASLRTLVEASTAEVADLRAALAIAESTRSGADVRLRAAEASLSHHLSLCSSLRKLPVELLANIMLATVEDLWDPANVNPTVVMEYTTQRMITAVRLASVSKHWRSTAKSQRRLWRAVALRCNFASDPKFAVRSSNIARMFINRASPLPLDIVVDRRMPTNFFDDEDDEQIVDPLIEVADDFSRCRSSTLR